MYDAYFFNNMGFLLLYFWVLRVFFRNLRKERNSFYTIWLGRKHSVFLNRVRITIYFFIALNFFVWILILIRDLSLSFLFLFWIGRNYGDNFAIFFKHFRFRVIMQGTFFFVLFFLLFCLKGWLYWILRFVWKNFSNLLIWISSFILIL